MSGVTGIIEKLILTAALSISGYVLLSTVEMQSRVAVVESVQLDEKMMRDSRQGFERQMLERTSTLEAEMRELRRTIESYFRNDIRRSNNNTRE